MFGNNNLFLAVAKKYKKGVFVVFKEG